MSYVLRRPFEANEYTEFIAEHNHKNARRIEITDSAIYALEDNEILGSEGVPIINPNYENEVKAKECATKVLHIKAGLNTLDAQAVRPLRAILTGSGTDEDKEILEDIESRASILRKELSSLL